MQGLFRNPMADPYIVGISPGAALGAVLATVLGLSASFAGLSAVPLAAFAGGIWAALAVVMLARQGSRFPVADLLLVGLAVGAFAGAGYSFLILTLDDGRIASVLFWLLGSFSPADWGRVLAALPYLVVAVTGLMFMARDLDVFSLGEEDAGYLGLRVERLKMLCVAFAALAASAAVAVSGVIGFVGLIVPHVARLLVGPPPRPTCSPSRASGAPPSSFSPTPPPAALSPRPRSRSASSLPSAAHRSSSTYSAGAASVAPEITLAVQGVRVGYGADDKLHGVTLEVPKGSFLAVVGPNGSGKSTLLRTMARALKPRLGAVLLDDREVESWGRKSFAREVAVVSQEGPPGLRLHGLRDRRVGTNAAQREANPG